MDISRYYFLDSIGMLLSILAVFLLGKKIRLGFIVFAGANVLWIGIGYFLMDSIGIILGNLVFFAINLKGYINWK